MKHTEAVPQPLGLKLGDLKDLKLIERVHK